MLDQYGILEVVKGQRTRLLVSFKSGFSNREIANKNNTAFRIRCTLPHARAIRGKDGRFRSLFILLNGLGETDVTPYDELADQLADLGIPSVFLPLPGHFCRHEDAPSPVSDGAEPVDDYKVRAVDNDLAKSLQKRSQAILMRFETSSKIWLTAYQQTMSDVVQLIDSVRGVQTDGQLAFNNAFGPNTRISIYGYSMGGLMAISATLIRANLIRSCFVINSGTGLKDINADRLFHNKWNNVKRGIREAFDAEVTKAKDTEHHDNPWPYCTEFRQVFLGMDDVTLQNRISKLCRRILFVVGARDEVFRVPDVMHIAERETGVALMQLPAVGHYISVENLDRPEWQRWSRFLAALLLEFEQRRPQDSVIRDWLDNCVDGLGDFVAPGEYLRARFFLLDGERGILLPAGASGNISETWEAEFHLRLGDGLCGELMQKHMKDQADSQVFAYRAVPQLSFPAKQAKRLSEARVSTVAVGLVWSPHPNDGKYIGAVGLASNHDPVGTVLRTSVAQVEIVTLAWTLGQHVSRQGGAQRLLSHIKEQG